MKIFNAIPLCLFSVSFFVQSCKKYEGQGGKSAIIGKITIDEKLYINGSYSQTVSYPGAKEDVYIVYGTDDLIYDDNIECNYDGSFKFDYLQPGDYTIFAYNKVFHTGNNPSNNDDDYYTLEPYIKQITIKKNETGDLGIINLSK